MDDFPEETKSEKLAPFVRGIAGAMPWLGPGIGELYNAVFIDPVNKRRWDFVIQLSEDFKELKSKVEGLTDENLANNPKFVSAMANGILVATKTHQQEKLDALRKGILNSALPTCPDDDLVTVFFNLIDVFTPLHLQILKYLEDPRSFLINTNLLPESRLANNQVWSFIIKVYPEFKKQEGLLELVLLNLVNHHLIKNDYKMSKFIEGGLSFKILTNLGSKFLNFIENPHIE